MWALIDQLVQQGVTDFFLAPGSRSTPLALSVAKHPKAKLHRHFDERGLGFFALGNSLATKKPSAIIVTSGTAVGNLLPAVMEAHYASIPLIFLTADRPSELRESSANQTCDQTKIFQNFVRWQFEIEPTMPTKAVRSHAAQAVFKATGPVHINCPAREPFYPLATDFIQGSPIHLVSAQEAPLPPQEVSSRGIILLGSTPDIPAVLALSKQLQWPIFADILSSARLHNTENQILHFDWLLANAKVPPTILHFGDRLTSKRLLEWLKNNPPQHYIHISPTIHWNDPSHLITARIKALPSSVHFHNTPDPTWLPFWRDQKVSFPPSTSFTETTAVRILSEMPLDNHAIFLGNSMPIREADWFLFPKQAKAFYANRGLSGIDGNIATIAGLAQHSPVLALIGDLTALHDLNSLHLLKNLPVTLLISNNNGGGIFSHLPYASDPDFDKLWGFTHNHTFSHAAGLFNIPFSSATDTPSLEAALNHALLASGPHIIEFITSRETNSIHHKTLRNQIANARE